MKKYILFLILIAGCRGKGGVKNSPIEPYIIVSHESHNIPIGDNPNINTPVVFTKSMYDSIPAEKKRRMDSTHLYYTIIPDFIEVYPQDPSYPTDMGKAQDLVNAYGGYIIFKSGEKPKP